MGAISCMRAPAVWQLSGSRKPVTPWMTGTGVGTLVVAVIMMMATIDDELGNPRCLVINICGRTTVAKLLVVH